MYLCYSLGQVPFRRWRIAVTMSRHTRRRSALATSTEHISYIGSWLCTISTDECTCWTKSIHSVQMDAVLCDKKWAFMFAHSLPNFMRLWIHAWRFNGKPLANSVRLSFCRLGSEAMGNELPLRNICRAKTSAIFLLLFFAQRKFTQFR